MSRSGGRAGSPEPGSRARGSEARQTSFGDDSHATRLVEALVGAAGRDQLRAILLFGSQLVSASPGRFSAFDLVVVVERYRAFYDALATTGWSRRSPALQAALNHVLAPNVIAFAPDGWEHGPVAKIMVLEPGPFARALSGRAPDHFMKGRLVQTVKVIYARDPASAAWIHGLISGARGDVLRWVGPFLHEPFTAADAAWCMLRVSYAGEVRPEADDRVRDVFEAQRPFLMAVLAQVLEDAKAAGQVITEDRGYWFTRPPGALDRGQLRLYFLRSKVRATARWLKHVVTFDNWLDYIGHKVERRTGMQIEITPWERRLPYLLLWPKVIRVLSHRTSTPPDAEGSR